MLEAERRGGGEVAVIGLGRSGAAATRLLRREGLAVYASDSAASPALESRAAALLALGAEVELGRHDLGRIRRAALAVLSPGVPPEAPAVTVAREAGVAVRAEADLALEALGSLPYVAITGTNGKTTTTALVAHLLAAAGIRAEAAGNIGTPLCEMALLADPPDWLAVELSSFQLHDSPRVRPRVGILTNLAPDHLDRYRVLEEYYADKQRLFVNAGPESVWVSNSDDPESQRRVRGVPGRHLHFSVRTRADGWYDRSRDTLQLEEVALLPRAEFPLLGDHNVANALAAALAAREAGAAPEALAAGLSSFRALPHRLEPVREVGGVLWINDSKATNIASTEVAVAALDRPFVLLLGGRHKGEPYSRLAPLLARRCRAVVAYGEAQPVIVADLGLAIRVLEAGCFEEVLRLARELARPGDAVLLSPACSSYDMFTNYEERGARFRAIVEGWR